MASELHVTKSSATEKEGLEVGVRVGVNERLRVVCVCVCVCVCVSVCVRTAGAKDTDQIRDASDGSTSNEPQN